MKIMIFNGVLKMVLLMLPIMFFGLTIDTTKKIELPDCKPTLPNVNVFCGEVGSLSPYTEKDEAYDFNYQKTMYISACADANTMSDREINQKLREWWDLYKGKLVCDCLQFNVTNGSVFKFAISANNTSFVDDAIYAKLDFNFVDKSDGRIVLDYTRDELAKQSSSSLIRKTLQEYYDKLRAAGAKYRSEL
ncbi:hypothetical protein ACR79P_14665 [Sphingobacterium spiritivorum]|uniref:hypothetical protein n=1 Tax=Sphingobacterium spiritivorum TaxID=258 RepID=UPI003DA376CF